MKGASIFKLPFGRNVSNFERHRNLRQILPAPVITGPDYVLKDGIWGWMNTALLFPRLLTSRCGDTVKSITIWYPRP